MTLIGESHGSCVGVVVDGLPAGTLIDIDDICKALGRRQGNTLRGTTLRKENDVPEFISGVFDGRATGSAITAITNNQNVNSEVYNIFKDIPRPGHADFVALKKYKGFADNRGGGHFSGRLTWGIVVAGFMARQLLKDIVVEAKVISVGGSTDIEKTVDEAIRKNDSVGGVVECRVKGLPVGLGEPMFYSVESALSHFLFSIHGIKGLEFGAGFASSSMFGSQCNDVFIDENGTTLTNNAGGINGGITNGNELVFRVAVKPTSSIGVEQHTFNFSKKSMDDLLIDGRHDACIALRIPVIVEAATYFVLADLLMMNQ